MTMKDLSLGLTALIAIIQLSLSAPALAQQEKVLHYFGRGSDGTQVNAGIVADPLGNLYGSTTGGGRYQNGTVFELSPQLDGTWAESIVYSFGPPTYGYLPNAQVSLDADGNLYGTTTTGGAYNYGTVYKLSPAESGDWRASTLHSFNPMTGDDNSNSIYVIEDTAGNVYGSTSGGVYGDGFVFELTRSSTGAWTETILENFKTNGKGGVFPGNLILDTAGNVFGTASGGTKGGGLVFKLSPSASGWTETILHSFSTTGAGGAEPLVLAFDSSGNLYGLTVSGGASGNGVAFKLTPNEQGAWTEKILYNFVTSGGQRPSGLTIDASGNLYGTMLTGGPQGYGTVFKLSPESNGNWTAKLLHSFANNIVDGLWPYGTLVVDSDGNLYGSTSEGGMYAGGIVYEITP